MIQLKPKIFLVLSGMIFLLLVIGTPFFHNHEPDLQVHQDCPAFLMEMILHACVIFGAMVWISIFLRVENLCSELTPIFVPPILYRFARKRAPPVRDLQFVSLNA